MFTGLVERLGKVVDLREESPGKRLTIDAGPLGQDAVLGDSIAINGCCLTVVEIQPVAESEVHLSFEAGPETLSRTNLGKLTIGSLVNLERSLQFGDRLGGHLVTGHVDAIGTLAARIDQGDWSTYWFQMPPALGRQMASKGSIAVDGVSLTLVDVETERFSVALIPHTLQVTTLGQLSTGDPINLETDLLAKYVEKQLQFVSTNSPSSPS